MNDLTLDDLYEGSLTATPPVVDASAIQRGDKPPFGNTGARFMKTDGSYKDEKGLAKIFKGEEKKPSSGGSLSLDDLYEPVHQSDAEIQMGGLKAAGVAAAGEVAAFGDLILSAPGAISGSLGELFLRADLSRDKTIGQRGAASAGREFREYITQKGSPTWFSDIVKQFTPPGEKPQETTVARALGWLEKKIDAGGEIVDKATGGKINKDDVSGFVNGAINALGLKATMGIGKGKKAEPKPEPEKIDPVLDPEGEPAPKPATKEQLKELQAQVRKKYTDDAEYAKHYAKQAQLQSDAIQTAKAAEERLKNPTPSTDPIILTPEAKVDAGTIGQRSLDTGLEKTIQGKKFDLTAEERIALKAAGVRGRADLDALKGIAAVGVGLTIGANLAADNPIEGAVLGALAGATAVSGGAPKLYNTLKEFARKDDRIRINDLTEGHETFLKQVARDVYQVQNKLFSLVPDAARRVAINTAIDQGKIAELKGKEKEAAHIAQEFYARVGEAAQKLGVLDDVRDNYTTHLWDKADKAKLDAILQARSGPSMSPNSRFAKARSHVTLEEGKAAGLKPVTEDIAAIIGMYGNSIGRSMANRKLIDGLKEVKVPGTDVHLVRPMSKAPLSYVSIDSPHLQGLRVHPDIAPSLKFMFEAQDPGAVMAALGAVNTALKRNAVSFSLFHAKALLDAALGAVSNPLVTGKFLAQAALPKIFGQDKYLKMVKEGGAGDLVDHAFKDGLVFSFEKAESAVEDVGGGFYKGMKALQDTLDAAIPKSGTVTVGSYIRVNHALDNFMWGRLHAGLKLSVYASKVEALMENSAKAGKALTRDEAGKIAASYTNDIFGGLNWQRIAEGARTKFGRDLALSALSPKSRRGIQLLLFAPDWTLSTARAFTQAVTKDVLVRPDKLITGLFSAKNLGDLHRQQLLRSAFYYVTIGDAINYANSGHHIWENKDWTRVDLGDGRSMQLSKHFMEPFHWMTNGRQQGLNKLGTIPKETTEQLLGVDHLQAKGRMIPMDDSASGRIKHAIGSTTPIGVQQFQQGGAAQGLAGMLGAPIYGQTPEQKRQARYEAQLKRFRKHQQELEEKKK